MDGGTSGSGVVGGAQLSRLLIVDVAGELFAIDAGAVREVVSPSPLTRGARLPDCVLGLAALRGEPFPVLDLAHLLGRPASALTERSCFILIRPETASRLVALAAQRIVGTERIQKSQLMAVPSVGGGEPAARLLGLATVGDRVAPVLDLRGLLDLHSADLEGCAPPLGVHGVQENIAVQQRSRGDQHQVLILAAGDTRIGVETAGIARVVPRPTVGCADAPDGNEQTVEVDGNELTVVDAMRLLGVAHGASDTLSAAADEQRGVVLTGRADDSIAIAFGAVVGLTEFYTEVGSVRARAGVRLGLIETRSGVVELVSLSALLDQGGSGGLRARIGAKRTVGKIGASLAKTEVAGASKVARVPGDSASARWEHLAGPVLVVAIGERIFALPGGGVVEVLPKSPLLSVPGAAARVVGLLELRGTVHPVLDVASQIDAGGAGTAADRAYIVLARDANGFTGLLVDAVVEWRKITAKQLASPERLTAKIYPDLISAALTTEDAEPIPLLEIGRLLADTRPDFRDHLRTLGM